LVIGSNSATGRVGGRKHDDSGSGVKMKEDENNVDKTDFDGYCFVWFEAIEDIKKVVESVSVYWRAMRISIE
jgi:hypothetical protein